MGAAGAATLKLLLDEMLDPEIAFALQRRGLDVESIQAEHQDLMGGDDTVVLEQAARLERTLVTDNVRNFLPHHEAYLSEHKRHAGLLLAHARAYPRSKKTIGIWVRGIEGAARRLGSRSMDNVCECLP